MELSEEELLKLVGSVFIVGKTRFFKDEKPERHTLAIKITNDPKFEKRPSSNNKISYKVLENLHNYFFKKGNEERKLTTPNDETKKILLKYVGSETIEHFIQNNAYNKDYYLKNTPNSYYNEEYYPKNEINIESKEEEKKYTTKHIQTNQTTAIEKPNKNHAFFAFCVVAIIIVAFFFAHISKTPNIKIVNDLRQIHPTKETQFFSPTTNEPLVFYANYNQKIEFFNANGVHPKTKQPLKPVTQEFIKTHFVGKLPVLTAEEQQQNEVVLKKTNYNNKPLSKQNNSPKLTDKKTKDVPKTKVIIKDNAQTDYELSSLFKKNYTKTKKPYTCTGKVTYTFRESDNGHFVCELGLSYVITNNTTKKTIDEGFIKSKGAGFSESSARNNALEKIQFD